MSRWSYLAVMLGSGGLLLLLAQCPREEPARVAEPYVAESPVAESPVVGPALGFLQAVERCAVESLKRHEEAGIGPPQSLVLLREQLRDVSSIDALEMEDRFALDFLVALRTVVREGQSHADAARRLALAWIDVLERAVFEARTQFDRRAEVLSDPAVRRFFLLSLAAEREGIAAWVSLARAVRGDGFSMEEAVELVHLREIAELEELMNECSVLAEKSEHVVQGGRGRPAGRNVEAESDPDKYVRELSVWRFHPQERSRRLHALVGARAIELEWRAGLRRKQTPDPFVHDYLPWNITNLGGRIRQVRSVLQVKGMLRSQ